MLIICVSSAAANKARRRAVRRSWFTLLDELGEKQRGLVKTLFILSSDSAAEEALQAEQEAHGDLLLVDAAEGYEHLWRKALVSLQLLEDRFDYSYYLHVDDDSYVRIDLVLQLLERAPKERFYWGYIWDSTGNRHTAPIRNPRNKSHMPKEQYALDYYPPFASGCGFILSRDLVQALLKQPLPDYRLLDPPFGIHLCGPDFCVLPEGPVVPVHDEAVRPYRGIPVFKASTVVQHYLAPEEMAPFHEQVIAHIHQQNEPAAAEGDTTAAQQQAAPDGGQGAASAPQEQHNSAADELYSVLVNMGLLRR